MIFTGPAGAYSFETSADLRLWTSLGQVTNGLGQVTNELRELHFRDLRPLGSASRFYRLHSSF